MANKVLDLKLIQADERCQQRATIPLEVVREYGEALLAKAKFPPVIVFFDGKSYWLADGFIRRQAHLLANHTRIKADVRSGSLDDAILFSAGANASHGLRRTHADKQRAVQALLASSKWSGRSDRWIGEAARVDGKTVARIRAETEGDRLRNSADGGGARLGKDDRLRPAQKAAGLDLADSQTWEEPFLAGDDNRDALGIPIPADKFEAFRDITFAAGVRQAVAIFHEVRRRVDELAKVEGGDYLTRKGVLEKLVDAKTEAIHWRHLDFDKLLPQLVGGVPYLSFCPRCRVRGEVKGTCTLCKGVDWICKDLLKGLRPEEKEAVEAAKAEAAA